MNTLVNGYLSSPNDFQLDLLPKSVFPRQENRVSGSDDCIRLTNGLLSSVDEFGSSEESESNFRGKDHSDEILNFITQMLMEEEDLESKPCMLNDCLALQATEQSLLNVLNNNHNENQESPNDHFTGSCGIFSCSPCSSNISSSSVATRNTESLVNTPWQVEYPFVSSISSMGQQSESQSSTVSRGQSCHSASNYSSVKRNRYREEGDHFVEEHRSNKFLANTPVELELSDMFDKVLLCSISSEPPRKPQSKGTNRGRPKGCTKQGSTIIKEFVDLRSLLMQCAQALTIHDRRTVSDLLAVIRQHSSPHGDGTERLAHYFANALEARLAGMGTESSYAAGLSCSRISAAEILKAYKVFITACPYKKMSIVFANKTIKKLADGATTLHIIDFGILYGFQWPCLIQALSERPGGPPKLRITGIDFPQPGFRPTERVAETGRRLAKYCMRFGVPFEYIPIAQKWETIKIEDLKIDRNNHELLVVNSIYRLHNVMDETLMVDGPRDAVISLIKNINPDMFILGVINAMYNTPFFLTRFREALFHFSSYFDMFDDTVPREDQNRLHFEEEVFAKDAMNTIACEGMERIDRPETYKQWGVRNWRAGFRQLPLDQEILKFVRRKVKMEYHKDFSVDEDGKWMLQGWKGRVLFGISCWQPVNKSGHI